MRIACGLLLIGLAAAGGQDEVRVFDEAVEAGRFDDAARILDVLALRPPNGDPLALLPMKARLERARSLAELRRTFEAGKAVAEDRLRVAREAVVRDAKEEGEREARIAAALQELSAREPLRVKLPGDVFLENVRVAAYAAGRVKLAWPQGEVEFPFELLPEETRAVLLGGILSKAAPRDQIEVGKLLLRAKDYDRAARCFASATKRDPSLAELCPDLERIKRAARLFEGSFKASGSSLSIRWTFAAADELKDFAALKGQIAARPGQGLEVSGGGLALAVARDIPFRERVRASLLAKETDGAAHLMGIRFLKPGGGEVILYGALATAAKVFAVVRVEDDEAKEVLPATGGAVGNRMTMDFNRGRFSFQIGDRTVWSGNEGGFTEVSVILGASPLQTKAGARGEARAVFREVGLLGGVDPVWMSKKTAAWREALHSELAREQRLAGGTVRERSFELSVDGLLARAAPELRSAYPPALERLRAALKSGEGADLSAARKALEGLTGMSASFAPAWYFRGMLEEAAGDDRAAAANYDLALAELPDFPEALCARAMLDLEDWRWAQAAGRAERALALRPDLGEGHLLRARLQYEAGDVAAAHGSARLARKLSPLEPRVQVRAQSLENALRGPAWAKPNAHESAHYVVRSDLAPAKCRAYAEHLEAVRTVYEEVLGRKGPEGKRSPVLIFDAEEGYYSYLDVTVGGRQEHTLGVFSPWHGQMVLFEDADAEETLRVLAHEGFHQFLQSIAPAVPIWFNEGMAEYVGATRIEKGQVVERGGVQQGRLNDLKFGAQYGWRPLAFERIMTQPQSEFYDKQAPLKYAQAWSMVQFFMQGEGGRWKPVLQAYIERLVAGDDARGAFSATFGREDLEAAEAAWRKHFGLPAGLVPVRPAASGAAPAPAAVPAPAAPGTAPPAPASPAIDLLALLKARNVRGYGWSMFPDGFYGRGETVPRAFDLRFEPAEEYDLKIEVLRPGTGTGLRLGLAAGGRQFALELDGGHQGHCFLDMLDGRSLQGGNPSLVQNKCLPSGRKVILEVAVRKSGLRASVEGKPVLEWQGDYSRLNIPREVFGLSSPKTLWLSSTPQGEFQITSWWVLPPGGALPAPASPATSAPAAEKPKAATLTVPELKERLASKEDRVRIEAVTELGLIRDREARKLLGERLLTDSADVRIAAARALTLQRHPQSVEALGKALRVQQKSEAVTRELILSLGTIDMCASIPHLIGALDVEGGKHLKTVLEELKKINCREAVGGLLPILAKADTEARKPPLVKGRPNGDRNNGLANLREPIQSMVIVLMGGPLPAGETWASHYAKSGGAKRLAAVHFCELKGEVYEVAPGATSKCPQPPAAGEAAHEDYLIKHRPE